MKKYGYIALLIGGVFIAYKLLKKQPENPDIYRRYYHIYVSQPSMKTQGGRVVEMVNIYDQQNDNSFWATKEVAEEYIAEREKNPLYAIVRMDVSVIPVEELRYMDY